MTTWHTTTPPQDGTQIVAVGRVLWEDDFSAGSQPFAHALFWNADAKLWCYWHGDQMALTTALNDQVKIDWWLPLPQGDLSLLTSAPTEILMEGKR